MKHRHMQTLVAWLRIIAVLSLVVAFVTSGSLANRLPTGAAFLLLMMAGFVRLLVGVYYRVRRKSLMTPHGSHAMPVKPTGIPAGELTIGDEVLTDVGGVWLRSIVIRLFRGDRVEVHFVGWDSFWDSIVPRSNLQVRGDASLETSIVAGQPAWTFRI